MFEIKGVSVLEGARFGCACSGGCCGGYLYGPIDDETAERILRHQFIENAEQIKKFGHFDEAEVHGEKVRVLRRVAGHCVFLGKDRKCVIHKEIGAEAKPIFCQIYPINVTLAPDGIAYISLNLECIGDGVYKGPLLEDQIVDDLDTLVEQASLQLAPEVTVRVGKSIPFEAYLEEFEQPWLESLEQGAPLEILKSIFEQLFENKEKSQKCDTSELLSAILQLCAEDEADSLAEDDRVDAAMNRAVIEAGEALKLANDPMHALFLKQPTNEETEILRLELQNALFGKSWLRASSLQVACVLETLKIALAYELSKTHRFSKALALVNRVLRFSTLAAPEFDELLLKVGQDF